MVMEKGKLINNTQKLHVKLMSLQVRLMKKLKRLKIKDQDWKMN